MPRFLLLYELEIVKMRVLAQLKQGIVMDSPKRRWYRPQFGLRGLIHLFLITSILVGWYADRTRLSTELDGFRAATMIGANAWSVEQVTGKPNTNAYGDIATAWASATQDGQKEWLELTYAQKMVPGQILVHETYNPGAVYRVTGFDVLGRERLLWSGTDPKRPGSGKGVSKIIPKYRLSTNRIRVYLDSPKVPGWNEIDAVALHGKDGSVQWASNSAKASSSYGQQWSTTLVRQQAIRIIQGVPKAPTGTNYIPGFQLDAF